MTATFVDAYYYLALLNPRDAGHYAALDATDRRSGRLVTTQWILTEVGDAFSAVRWRVKFLELLEQLENNRNANVVPVSPELFERGVELFRQRPDKDWPLTDCISFVVMEAEGIDEALTADVHFQQAGFKALLLEG